MVQSLFPFVVAIRRGRRSSAVRLNYDEDDETEDEPDENSEEEQVAAEREEKAPAKRQGWCPNLLSTLYSHFVRCANCSVLFRIHVGFIFQMFSLVAAK